MKAMTKNKNAFQVVLFVLLTSVLFVSGCVTTDGDGAKRDEEATPIDEKADIYAELATGYMKKEQYSVAQQELEKALSIAPNHSQSNYVMGLLMIEIEEYDRVEAFMVRAVQSDPKNSAAAHDLGTFLCQTGKEERSVIYFDRAVANPFFNRPELSLMRAGECLNKIGKLDRAETYLKKSLEFNSNLQPSLLNLAKIKYDQASYLSARAYIERYFAITKPQPAALYLGYQIESKLNAKDVAEKYRTAILEEFPSSNQARTLRNKS